jgi:hypothetical protein
MQDVRRSPHSGLPAPADLFVGRDGELAAVSGMLANTRVRLVTLTGRRASARPVLPSLVRRLTPSAANAFRCLLTWHRSGIRRW